MAPKAVASKAPAKKVAKPAVDGKKITSVAVKRAVDKKENPSHPRQGNDMGNEMIRPSLVHADGIKRCWGESYTTTNPALLEQHDKSWGQTNVNSRHLFTILCLEMFSCGLSWGMVLKKLKTFEARFESFDYEQIATWGDEQVQEAMADTGIVRNMAKIRATASNAQVAVSLDKKEEDGFKKFVWRTCGLLPDQERLLQLSSRSGAGSYMRSSSRVDYEEADGVHPTVGVALATKEFKKAGFKFLGPCTMLSFMQEVGAVNNHSPDCEAFNRAEAAYAKALKEMGGKSSFTAAEAVTGPAAAAPAPAARGKRRAAYEPEVNAAASRRKTKE